VSERILIVDDDPVHRRLLETMVRKLGYEPCVADGGDAALAMLCEKDCISIDAVVLDLVMRDLDGLGVLAGMREASLNIPVIVQTANGGIDNVATAIRAGAADFMVKPASPERLQVSLRNALATTALQDELARMKRSRDGTLGLRDLISKSPRMQHVLRFAQKAAASTNPVLIEGERGVGKEFIARVIHGMSERRTMPFVAVSCSAVSCNIETLLFGHAKGTFAGAPELHTGKFVEASTGTLFLDEVGELPAAVQARLLRALTDNEIESIGARKPVKIDVRLISTTSRDLIADVRAGRFREDLFYRLQLAPISVPPLRERPEDIPELARHFLARFAAEQGKRVARISAEAVDLLRAYDWPGNVRQLENAVFRAVVLCEGDTITVTEFPQIATSVTRERLRVGSDEPLATTLAPADEAHAILESVAARASTAPYAFGNAPASLDLVDASGHVRPIEDLEADAIRYAIAHYGGQMSEVARRLRIGRSTLYRKLDLLGIHS
jgi:DNA-binding NtrC family response regulator